MDELEEKMAGWWVKLFVIHMLMRARPDVEWILWMDSDTVFTNMTFQFPLDKYKDYNMVMQGYDNMLFEEKNWLGINTGQNSLPSVSHYIQIMPYHTILNHSVI